MGMVMDSIYDAILNDEKHMLLIHEDDFEDSEMKIKVRKNRLELRERVKKGYMY